MVARVSPSCINKELMRLISSVFRPQAMVFAKAVTAAVRLQAFISDHPFISEYARRVILGNIAYTAEALFTFQGQLPNPLL